MKLPKASKISQIFLILSTVSNSYAVQQQMTGPSFPSKKIKKKNLQKFKGYERKNFMDSENKLGYSYTLELKYNQKS